MHLRPYKFRMCAACLSDSVPCCNTLINKSCLEEPERLAERDIWIRIPACYFSVPFNDLLLGWQPRSYTIVKFAKVIAGNVSQAVWVEEVD